MYYLSIDIEIPIEILAKPQSREEDHKEAKKPPTYKEFPQSREGRGAAKFRRGAKLRKEFRLR